MQSGAMGLPSIVSNINGCNEIIADRENGLIIPAKNIDKLEEAMVELLVNVTICSEMAKNARTSIVNRFAQKQVWEAILAEYQSLEGQ
jgi:glycosyltransferase involved in cell wall biosynthesis